jgi:hypothetical protein
MGEVDFLINRGDLHDVRFADAQAPEAGDGEAVLAVERFGLTANNITYAVFGEAMNYWDFFPAENGWGRMPVWGFASVSESKHSGVEVGARVYGYLPPSNHLLVVPDRIDDHGFIDAAPHRAPLPSAYQGYRRTDNDPIYDADREDEQILFWPLFYTSFLIDDEIDDEKFFGADTVALSSASSKTALIAAFLLAQRDGVELVGLTSAANKEFVEGLKIYDEVLSYDEISSLPRENLVYADFSGNGDLRAEIHEHCGDGLAHDMVIGATHHEEMATGGQKLPGPAPKLFFAPDRIRKRGEDWGTPELEKRVAEAWHPFAEWSGDWIEVRKGSGREDLEKTYLEVLDGDIGPEIGPVISLIR